MRLFPLAPLVALLATFPVWAAPAGVQRKAAAKSARPRRAPSAARCRDIFCTTQVLRLDGSGGDTSGLTEEQVEQTVSAHRRHMETCLIDARRRNPHLLGARVEFVVSSQGKVLASRVDGRRGSPLARCIAKEMRIVRFPSFKQSRAVAAVTLSAPQ